MILRMAEKLFSYRERPENKTRLCTANDLFTMKRHSLSLSLALPLILSACAAPQTGAAPGVPGTTSTISPTSAAPVADISLVQSGKRQAVKVDGSADPLHSALLPADQETFARRLADERNLPLAAIESALAQARYNDTVARLMAPPAAPEGKPRKRHWPAYRSRFVEPIRIRHGLSFWEENQDTLTVAEKKYGVPASIIAAIIGVETVYGRNMGNFSVLDALYTLAFSYPDHARRDRSPFFREELAEFLTMTLRQGVDPTSIRGSYAGAIGMPQFMPGSIGRYAVSMRPGRSPDLVNNPDDAIMSVANYLAGHGWRAGHPVFLPATLPTQPDRLVDGGLEPTLSWQQLASAGARLGSESRRGRGLIATAYAADAVPAWTSAPMGVVNLDSTTGPTEYRLAGSNFFVITKYNRSYFYAASVADLAQALEKARRQ